MGWAMGKLNFPTILLVIGFILSPILERSARQTMILVDASDGWLTFIASRPVLMILLGILAVLMGLVFRQRMVMRRYVLPQPVTDKE
jgi:TctA family transporter